MKLKNMVLLGCVVFGLAATAVAQGGNTDGCPSSPENPTAILALVGSAGGIAVAVRGRFARRKK